MNENKLNSIAIIVLIAAAIIVTDNQNGKIKELKTAQLRIERESIVRDSNILDVTKGTQANLTRTLALVEKVIVKVNDIQEGAYYNLNITMTNTCTATNFLKLSTNWLYITNYTFEPAIDTTN